jgi:hypothetical protein
MTAEIRIQGLWRRLVGGRILFTVVDPLCMMQHREKSMREALYEAAGNDGAGGVSGVAPFAAGRGILGF